MYYRRGNKFNATKIRIDNIKFDSQKEAHYYLYLKQLKQEGKIKDFEMQIRIPLIVNDKKITTYIADFRVINLDDSIEIVETKGYWTDYSKLKRKIFEATYLLLNPEVKYSVV